MNIIQLVPKGDAFSRLSVHVCYTALHYNPIHCYSEKHCVL